MLLRKIMSFLFVFIVFNSYAIEYNSKEVLYELKMVEGYNAPIKDWEVGIARESGDTPGPPFHCPRYFYPSSTGAIYLYDIIRGGIGSSQKPRILIIEDSFFHSFEQWGRPIGDIPGRVFVVHSKVKVFTRVGELIEEFSLDGGKINYYASVENGNLAIRQKNSNELHFIDSELNHLYSVTAKMVDPGLRLYNDYNEIISRNGKTLKKIKLDKEYKKAYLMGDALPEAYMFDKYGDKYRCIIVDTIDSRDTIYNKKGEIKNIENLKKAEYGFVVYDINGNELGKISFERVASINSFQNMYAYANIDFYGNIYVSECTDKYRISKYAKIHLLPEVDSSLNTQISDLRIDKEGKKYYKTNSNWNNPPPSLPQKGGYVISEYYHEPRKINEIGFKIIEDGKVRSKERLFLRGYENPIKELKYLGTDESGASWIYVEKTRVRNGKVIKGKTDWEIYRESKNKKGQISLDDFINSRYFEHVPGSGDFEGVPERSIPGVMNKDKVELLTIRVGYDGFLYFYKRKEKKWFKIEEGRPHSPEETELGEVAPKKKGIEVKQYTIYDEIDPVEMERGIEIKKNNQSIRKFKYYYQDTLYTVRNLGLDDKNNIYVYVNWFDWLTKDKMKEVVKFNTKGEFQNRIRIENAETPVLGQDGFVYTYEKGEKGIVRKYEPKTLPQV